MSADLLSRLIAAGTPTELVGEVAMALAKAEATAAARVEAALAPSKGALRMRRYRERHAPSPNVTCDGGDAQVTGSVTKPAPSPPSPKSPQTPQEPLPPHPHPEGNIAYACEAARLVLAVIEAGCRSAIEHRGAAKRRWPRDMPPPAGVSEDQWAGLIDHRKARRAALTPRAYQLLCDRLAEIANDEWPPGRLVDLIVERNWLTVNADWLPTSKEIYHGKRPHHDRPSGPIESRRRFREQHGLGFGESHGPE